MLTKETTTLDVLQKKMFLKISQILHENSCVGSLFNKVSGLRPAPLLKRDFNTTVCM